jgi:ribonuclease BN (tRNA processing enzyme)
MSSIYFKCWGVRGSIPVPGPTTLRYGGNTSCFELYTDEGDQIIFDAGSGIRPLGGSIDFSKRNFFHIILSHTHWDHINGLPLSPLIFIPGNEITIYGPRTHELSLEEIINGQMKYSYFPVRIAELKAAIKFIELSDGNNLRIGNLTIDVIKINHPIESFGYKVGYKDKKFIYLGDNEPYYNIFGNDDPDVESTIAEMNGKLSKFVSGADVLITDAQYTPAEYRTKIGWGHSSTHHAGNLALKSGVKNLYFNHHDPLRTDDELDQIVNHYKTLIKKKGLDINIGATAEGLEITV